MKIILVLTLFFSKVFSSDLQAPFWRQKIEVYNKIQNERYVAVSVLAKPVAKDSKLFRMTMSGGGWMNVPVNYAYAAATHYDNLKRVSDYVKEVKFNAQAQELFLHLVAFGYHANVKLKLSEESKDNKKYLQWRVLEGVFPGMTGYISFENVKNSKSEVAIWGEHTYSEWPIPKLFLEFGLEVVLQRFGQSLRALVEADFKSGVKYAQVSGGISGS